MSGEMQDKYVEDLEAALKELIAASKPMTSSDNIDETSGTIPLIDSLKDAINHSEKLLAGEI